MIMIWIVLIIISILLLLFFIRLIKINHDKKKYGLYTVVSIKNKKILSKEEMKKFGGKRRVNPRARNGSHYAIISSIDPGTNDITVNTINSLPENSQNRKNKVKNGELLPIPRSKTNMSKPNAIHNKSLKKNLLTQENLNIKDVIKDDYHGKKISTSFIPKVRKHIYKNKKQEKMSKLNRKNRHKKY